MITKKENKNYVFFGDIVIGNEIRKKEEKTCNKKHFR